MLPIDLILILQAMHMVPEALLSWHSHTASQLPEKSGHVGTVDKSAWDTLRTRSDVWFASSHVVSRNLEAISAALYIHLRSA